VSISTVNGTQHANTDTPTPNAATPADTGATRHGRESRACILHICGGVAMLAAGAGLLMII